MATVNSGIGWTCDSSYYVHDAGTDLTTDGKYEKHYDGAAICAEIKHPTYDSYITYLMSTDETFAKVFWRETSDAYEVSITIDGVLWYISYASGSVSERASNFPLIVADTGNGFNDNEGKTAIVTAIKNAASVEFYSNITSVNYVKTFVEGVEAETATRVNANKTAIGTLSNLTTTAKTDAVSAINELNSAKQPKTMSAAITVDGTSQTTVEGALSAINTLAAGNKTNKQDKNLSSAITVDGTSQTTVENAIGAINNFASTKISDIYANLGIYGSDIYGLQVDYQNYIYTRLCGAVGKTVGTDFNSLAPWSGMKRCNLADNGTVNAYYGDINYVEDGSNGQCMVEIPKFYYRVVPIKTEPINDAVGGLHMRKANYYISATKYEGFKTHPLFIKPDGPERDKAYVSAYEGCVYDVSTSAYILDDAQIADFTASTGDKLSSIANAKPASGLTQNLTRANSEVIATNRGTGWHCMDVKAVSAVQLLFMIEYGTLNSQNAIGLGVVCKTDDGSTNMSEITGATSSLGDATGMASGTDGLVSVSYRGVENFYGNIWKFIEGLIIWGDGTLRGGQPYICDDYNFVENTKTGYTAAKFTVTNMNGYISAFGYDPDFDWLFLPSECINADSNYPVGDYAWMVQNLNGYCVSLLGAIWAYGVRAGAFYWNLHIGAGYSDRSIGARLLYIP